MGCGPALDGLLFGLVGSNGVLCMDASAEALVGVLHNCQINQLSCHAATDASDAARALGWLPPREDPRPRPDQEQPRTSSRTKHEPPLLPSASPVAVATYESTFDTIDIRHLLPEDTLIVASDILFAPDLAPVVVGMIRRLLGTMDAADNDRSKYDDPQIWKNGRVVTRMRMRMVMCTEVRSAETYRRYTHELASYGEELEVTELPRPPRVLIELGEMLDASPAIGDLILHEIRARERGYGTGEGRG